MITELPHRSDAIVDFSGAPSDEMRAWMEQVSYQFQTSLPYVSTSNSTTSDIASSFTGSWEFNLLPDAMVSCKVTGTATLYFDFSNDGGTSYTTFPTNGFAVVSGIHEFHTAVKGPRTFRVRLVGTSLTDVALYTYFGVFRQPNSPINQTLGADSDAIVTRSFPSEVDKRLGRLGGVKSGDKFGYITGLGTSIQFGTPSSWVHLWAYGGQRTSPTSTFTPYMASDDAGDTGIDIEWTYLDANGDEQTVTVATNGQTPVSLGVTAQEVYRGENVDSTDLAGNVSCATTNSFSSGSPSNQDEVLAYIPQADGKTQVLARRVPAGKTHLVGKINLYLSRASGAAGSADVAFQVRKSGSVWVTERSFQLSTSTAINQEITGVNLPALTDYRVVIRDVSDNDSSISGSIEFEEVDA